MSNSLIVYFCFLHLALGLAIGYIIGKAGSCNVSLNMSRPSFPPFGFDINDLNEEDEAPITKVKK